MKTDVKSDVTGNMTSGVAGGMTGGVNLADESIRQHMLASGPVGAWRTLPGSHRVLYDESIRFDADGTGNMQTGGSLRGATTQTFLWRCAGYGVVECRPIYQEPEVSAPGTPEESDWFRIAFVIEPQATDAGKFWVLRETNSDGFWDLMAPLPWFPTTEHDPEKWEPVFGERSCSNKKLDHDRDST